MLHVHVLVHVHVLALNYEVTIITIKMSYISSVCIYVHFQVTLQETVQKMKDSIAEVTRAK